MRKFTVFVVVIALLAFGGKVVAAIDNGNIYTGCLNPGGNILKVAIGDEPAKPCVDDQLQISWSAEGPQGPPGAHGLSQGYMTDLGDVILNPDDPAKELMVLILPPGNYISNITVHGSYYPDGGFPKDTHAYLDCFVEANGEMKSGHFGNNLQGVEAVVFTFGFTLNEESEVITSCVIDSIADDSQVVTIHRSNWTAIQVDNLIRQPSLYAEGE
jgi:hypothetical protein